MLHKFSTYNPRCTKATGLKNEYSKFDPLFQMNYYQLKLTCGRHARGAHAVGQPAAAALSWARSENLCQPSPQRPQLVQARDARAHAHRAGTAHSAFKRLIPAKKFSRIFPHRIQQVCIISVSGDCMFCIIEICQIIASISVNSQFHKFLLCKFWRVFVI